MAFKRGFKMTPKEIVRSLIVGLTISAGFLGGGYAYTNYSLMTGEVDVRAECRDSYDRMVADLTINPTLVDRFIHNANCSTISTRVDNLLEEYSNGEFDSPVYITGYDETLCGEGSYGCVTNYARINAMIPSIMTIAYTADYGSGLENTVAHEYVHVLTNKAEYKWLEENGAELFVTNTGTTLSTVDYMEAVADCGIEYFTGEPLSAENGTYIYSCTPEQTAVSNAIITDTLVD